MYPQINLATGVFTNPPPGTTSTAVPGAGPSSPGANDTNSTFIRVVIAEKYRVAPPVTSPPQTGPLPGAAPSTSTINFDYERKILKELEAPQQSSAAAADSGLRQQDTYEALISQCTSQGYTFEEASLGLSVALATTVNRTDGVAVEQAARKLKQMKSMGYEHPAAAGALVASNGNVQAAVEMLI